MPIPEAAPLHLENPYGTSKLTGERIRAGLAASRWFSYTALRNFNAPGADPDGDIGEVHDLEIHLVRNATRASTDGRTPLTINGIDCPTGEGTAVREYVPVTDLADAHFRALTHLMEGATSDPLNAGTGAGVSVLEVVKACATVIGTPPPYLLGPRRAGDPARLVAAGDRISSVLDWQPVNRTLDHIIATAARWHARC